MHKSLLAGRKGSKENRAPQFSQPGSGGQGKGAVCGGEKKLVYLGKAWRGSVGSVPGQSESVLDPARNDGNSA